MTITLYKSSADPRALDKITSATQIGTAITVKPTEKVNIINPVFEVDYNDTYFTVNYLYCDTFDRYYYITNAAVNTGHRIELSCALDVRQSFSATIKNTTAVIVRSESIAQPTKIIDDKLPINPSKKIITSILLPETSNSFNTDAEYSYLLTVVGGTPAV